MRKTLLAAAALALPVSLNTQEASARSSSEAVAQTKTPAPSPNAIVDAAAKEEWVQIDTNDLVVMTLAPDANGKTREVVIQLMPAPFSQGWVSNIRTLARAKWYDGISVNRVQDNYVVQWGDPEYDNPESGETEQKALPEGLKVMGEDEYAVAPSSSEHSNLSNEMLGDFMARLPSDHQEALLDADGDVIASQLGEFAGLFRIADPYSKGAWWANGWPISNDNSGVAPVHCYGMVGVGRNYSPDTGSGAELYTVIGHAPRHLDRNIALVGRIISGMEHLSSLPRGTGELGFYTEEEAELRTPILSVRVVSDLAATGDYKERSAVERKYAYEYLSTESETFAKYTEARANRRDPFFIKPAGGADICNIPVPIRKFEYTRYEPLDGPAPDEAEAE